MYVGSLSASRVPHPAGHRRGRAPAAGRERLPPASVALLRARRGCKLRGLASGHRGLSRLAACKMLGAGRWATTHRQCLPGGTWFLGNRHPGPGGADKAQRPLQVGHLSRHLWLPRSSLGHSRPGPQASRMHPPAHKSSVLCLLSTSYMLAGHTLTPRTPWSGQAFTRMRTIQRDTSCDRCVHAAK